MLTSTVVFDVCQNTYYAAVGFAPYLCLIKLSIELLLYPLEDGFIPTSNRSKTFTEYEIVPFEVLSNTNTGIPILLAISSLEKSF